MASLSNINGLFDVHSTGAILFSTSHGTSGQILKSNGNAAPTWIPQSDIVGAYLPLAGGTLTGATATASGISFTVGGTAQFDGDMTLPAAADNFDIGYNLQTTGRIRFGHTSWNNSIGLESYWMVMRSNQNEGYKFIDSAGNTYVQFNASNNASGAYNSTFAGIVGMGSTGIYAGTAAQLNLPGRGLAIKNDKNGSNNNWSYIENTATGSASNINFYTGNNAAALTLAHNGNATFSGDVYSSGTSNSLVVISRDNMFVDAGQFYLGADDGTTDDSFRQRTASGSYFIESRKSGTWTNRLQINSAGTLIAGQGATFAGNVKIGNSTTGTPALNADDLVIDKGASESGITLISTAAASIRFGDAANTSIGSVEYNHNSNYMRFSTNNAERMRIDSSGNVTIGSSTLTGSRSLTLLSATNATNYDINFQQAGTTNFGRIRFTEGAADFQFFAQVGQDPNLTLQYGGNSFFSRGNVGIGTTSPNDLLNLHTSSASGNIGLKITRASQTHGFRIGVNNNHVFLWTDQAQEMAFATSNVQRMSISASGNVGIGTTSPDSLLQLESSANPDVELKISNTATVVSGQNFGGSKIRLIADGTNGDGEGALRHALVSETDSYDNWEIRSANSLGTLAFDTLGSEVMRITSDGDLCVSKTSSITTSASYGNITLDGSMTAGPNLGAITADATINIKEFGGKSISFFYGTTKVGSITNTASATAYNTSSDYRLKEDLQDFNGLDKVSKIPVYDFKWKTDESRSYGVVAHELQEVLPDAVSGKKDAEEMQEVDYSKIVPLLIKSIQELEAKIKKLENK